MWRWHIANELPQKNKRAHTTLQRYNSISLFFYLVYTFLYVFVDMLPMVVLVSFFLSLSSTLLDDVKWASKQAKNKQTRSAFLLRLLVYVLSSGNSHYTIQQPILGCSNNSIVTSQILMLSHTRCVYGMPIFSTHAHTQCTYYLYKQQARQPGAAKK